MASPRAPPAPGTRASTLSFGDLPENSAPLERVVTIMNTGAMEAVLVFHLMQHRAPHVAPDAIALDLEGSRAPWAGL